MVKRDFAHQSVLPSNTSSTADDDSRPAPGHLFPLHSRNSGPKIPRYNFLWATDTMRLIPLFYELPGHLIT